jgi:hypothetical protein
MNAKMLKQLNEDKPLKLSYKLDTRHESLGLIANIVFRMINVAA